MDALPWLLVHGDAVWRATLGVTFALATGLGVWRPRLRARRAARLARADLGWPMDQSRARKGHRVTLQGELDLTGATPELRVADGRVRLDGAMSVVVGSREEWASDKAVSRSLSSGDRVRVTGTFGEEASDDPTSYRDAAKRFTLSGGLVAAFEGAPTVSASKARIVARALCVTLAFVGVVFQGGGVLALRLGLRGLGEKGEPVGMALAAASPFTRHEALLAYARSLAARQDPDARVLRMRAELHALLGERRDAAEMWIAQGDPRRGAEMALAADDARLAARGFYADGDFTRAADTWSLGSDDDERELRFGLGVNLLAHRYDRAAKLARILAVMFRVDAARHPDRPPATWFHQRTEAALCLAESLEAASGGRGMRIDAHGQGSPRACAVLALDGLTGPARVRAAHDLPLGSLEADAHDVPMSWIALLALEAGGDAGAWAYPPSATAAEQLTVPNGGPLSRALPAVERVVAEREADHRVASSAAVFARLSGDAAAAKRLALSARSDEALAAVALPEDTQPADRELARAMGNLRIESLLADLAPLHGLRDFVADRNADEILRQLSAHPPPDETERKAWQLAASGYGPGLVAWLRYPTSQPGTFLRYGARLVRSGKSALVDWIRWGYRPVRAFQPTEDLVHLATLTDAARDLGDADTADLFAARTRRFREALLDRAISVPLAVLERL